MLRYCRQQDDKRLLLDWKWLGRVLGANPDARTSGVRKEHQLIVGYTVAKEV